MFLNVHSFRISCSPYISHPCHLQQRFYIREMYFRRKDFYQKSGQDFFFFHDYFHDYFHKYFHDCRLKNFIHNS